MTSGNELQRKEPQNSVNLRKVAVAKLKAKKALNVEVETVHVHVG